MFIPNITIKVGLVMVDMKFKENGIRLVPSLFILMTGKCMIKQIKFSNAKNQNLDTEVHFLYWHPQMS